MKGSSPETIDEYIQRYPKDIQPILPKIGLTIGRAAPDAPEAISSKVPTFRLGRNLAYFAALPKHVSFFPTSSGIAEFRKELRAYDTSKGTVGSSLDRPIPYGLGVQNHYRLSQTSIDTSRIGMHPISVSASCMPDSKLLSPPAPVCA